MDNKDFLQHYGILGMKWGRKRGSISITKSKNYSDDHLKKVTLRKKKIYEMTNAELKSLNERLQLEKQYRDLRKSDLSKGKNYVNRILKFGKTANGVYNLYNSPLVKQIKTVLDKKG